MHALITPPNVLLLLNVTGDYGMSWGNDERLALSHSGIDNASHTGHCHERSGTGGYLRGPAVGPDSLLGGESPRVNRAERPIARSVVWVIRRSDWQAIDAIDLGSFQCDS